MQIYKKSTWIVVIYLLLISREFNFHIIKNIYTDSYTHE